MPFYQLSCIAGALVTACVAVLSLAGRPLSKDEKYFSAFAFAAAFWLAANAALSGPYGFFGRVFIEKASFLGIIAAPLAFYNFTLHLTGRRKRRLLALKIALVFAVLLSLALFTPYLVKTPGYHGPVPGLIFPLLAIYAVGLFASSGYCLYLYRRGISGTGRKEAEYLLYACETLTVGVVLVFISYYGARTGSIGNILIAAGAAATYAFRKYNATEIRLTLTRAGMFTVLYALILGIPFWIGIKTERWKLAVALMGVLASIGPFVYGMLGKKVKDILLAQQRRYQKILLQFSQSMAKEHDLDRLSKFIVYTLKRAVKIEFAAIFLDSSDDSVYQLKAVRNAGAIHPKFHFSYKHPLVSFLKEHKKPVSIDDLPESLDGFKDVDLGVRLIVPSFAEERLMGFLFLGDKQDKSPYSGEDMSVFETLSNQAALAVENCLYLREFEKAQEKIFNADKLASLGGMADGVAHQIKNRLNQFSIAAGEQQYEIADFRKKYAKLISVNPELKSTFDYISEISNSLLDNVKKTADVIQGVLGFARVEERGAVYGEFAVEDIVKPTLALLCVKHQISEFPLELKGGPHVISGVKSQLMECLYNILDNAYEAVKDKIDYHLEDRKAFKPQITLKVVKKDRLRIIEVSDNGVGIKEENMNKIFAPFFTTKSSYKTGAGVGMYVVKRLIEEHNSGKIRVESEYLKGTRVFIELPYDGKAKKAADRLPV